MRLLSIVISAASGGAVGRAVPFIQRLLQGALSSFSTGVRAAAKRWTCAHAPSPALPWSAASRVAGLVVVLSLGSMTSCSDSVGLKPPEVSAIPQQGTSAGASLTLDVEQSDGRQESFLKRVRSVKGHHLMIDKKGGYDRKLWMTG